MKKPYESPQAQIVRYALRDTILVSPTDSPTTYYDEPELPTDNLEGDGLD